MAKRVRITVYPDVDGRWRWRMRFGNGRTFATSGESFASKGNARRAGDRLRELIATGAFVDLVVED